MRSRFARSSPSSPVRRASARGRALPALEDRHRLGRRTLAAATLENDRAHPAARVTNARAFKPGTPMPSFDHVDAATRDSLIAFLEGLE